MNYKVFKMDNPDTWPELNCPLLVWKPNQEWPYIFQWDPREHCFLDDRVTYRPKMCFYKYIGYMPYIKKELHPIQCAYLDEKGNGIMCPYGFQDDGYCVCDDGFKCEHQYKQTEYALCSKPIWKEY